MANRQQHERLSKYQPYQRYQISYEGDNRYLLIYYTFIYTTIYILTHLISVTRTHVNGVTQNY